MGKNFIESFAVKSTSSVKDRLKDEHYAFNDKALEDDELTTKRLSYMLRM